jgi:hypothetical protein
MRNFKFQIGQFFLVIGVIMLAVFFVTDQSHNPQYLLFFGSLLVGGFGFSLMMKNRSSRSEESARFRSVRRYRQKERERREKKRQRAQERREGKTRAQLDRRARKRQEQQERLERQRQEQQEESERQS